ncbi:MAG: hypothetical protein ABIS50_23125 [Luteolibacter sp.]|uniref:hypothetical protein n=1 Tax=Luteolibacter sp. TaxID=1962973 RepID=UPI003265C67E
MTDAIVVNRVLSALDPRGGPLRPIRRNGSILLAMPEDKEGALRTLRLYQPQRRAARFLANGLRLSILAGVHSRIPALAATSLPREILTPELPDVVPGSCGILLGSPEHRIRRAIATFRTSSKWEVAKIAFGKDGTTLLKQESRILSLLSQVDAAVPECLGLHLGEDICVMRMPYVTGTHVKAGARDKALALLGRWATDREAMPIVRFSEWGSISHALGVGDSGNRALRALTGQSLTPVIRHGDFARWNLLEQPGGDLTVIDWEWGHESGMPGLDLVHYFLQDFRLVDRLSPSDAINRTLAVMQLPQCQDYLRKTGWSHDPLLPIIASLAYKQGAGHQENRDVLDAALRLNR